MQKDNKVTFENYAIFQTGGKQYQAIPGKTIAIEKIEGEAGTKIEFSEVLFRKTGEDKFEFGKPYLNDSIKASIVKQTKGPKLIVFRHKRRKKQRTKKGHRQPLTVIRIESL
ncbi:50S ribosomal protein L21 [Candidatus Babeliales bacterium]|nr:50S ribosomal protein L21 [Candidatus Babeliales bacterium]MCF7899409.1 50S ribosomal protein L21 [Candidatus Babeliales bacterium]